ncbi:MAG: hypothetical protein ACLR5Y_04570 [Haemophilus parainfluenzae]
MGVWFEDMRVLAPCWQITGAAIGVNFDDRNAMIGKPSGTTQFGCWK